MKKNSEEKKNFNFKAWWSKINEKSFMPLVWLTLLGVIVWIICPLIHLSRVWRIGLVFFIFNSYLSYQIGRIMQIRKLSYWWLLLFPVVFAIAVLIHFAKYNFLLCLVYLSFELFGLWHDDFYKEKK